MTLKNMLIHLYKTAKVPSTHTIQRLLNVSHVRYTEYNNKTNDLKIEFSNGDNKNFFNVPSIEHFYASNTSPKRVCISSNTMQRIINTEHVRYAEYNNLNRELKVEYSNGDSKCFMNITCINDFVCDASPAITYQIAEIQSMHVDPGTSRP